MKFVLSSNILEHQGFSDFVSATIKTYPDADFLIAGDLLNIFPEPGENYEGSIFYELYGTLMITEMERLIQQHFQQLEESKFIEPLKEMFLPTGKQFSKAQNIAYERYSIRFFLPR